MKTEALLLPARRTGGYLLVWLANLYERLIYKYKFIY